MAAITPTLRAGPTNLGGVVKQYYGTGTANQADTLTTATVQRGTTQKLLYVTVNYSAAPTYTGTGLTVKIDSGLGSTYDFTLTSGTDNTQFTVYLPDPDIRLLPGVGSGVGDAIVVAAPAGGSGITASITVALLET